MSGKFNEIVNHVGTTRSSVAILTLLATLQAIWLKLHHISAV